MFNLHATPLRESNLCRHRKRKLLIALESMTAADFKELVRLTIYKS